MYTHLLNRAALREVHAHTPPLIMGFIHTEYKTLNRACVPLSQCEHTLVTSYNKCCYAVEIYRHYSLLFISDTFRHIFFTANTIVTCFPRRKPFNNNAPPFYKSGMSSRETMTDDATFFVSQGILCCRSRSSSNSNSSSIHYLTRYFAAPGLVKCFALLKYDCCHCAK